MTKTISINAAKAQIWQLLMEVEQTGEELIITDQGRSILRVMPFQEKQKVDELFEEWRGRSTFIEDPDTPTIDAWEDA